MNGWRALANRLALALVALAAGVTAVAALEVRSFRDAATQHPCHRQATD